MYNVLFLVILCGGLQLSQGDKLECFFEYGRYSLVGTLYTCEVTSLDNSFNNMTIEGYTGTHKKNKNDNVVRAIYIENTNVKYIPEGLGSLSKLTALGIETSFLFEIKAVNFLEMQILEYLSLYGNKLTSVPSDAFSLLTKLKFVDLDSNQIKTIESGAFDKLINLNEVGLRENICVNKNYEGIKAVTQMKEDIKAKCKNPHEIIIKLEQKNKDIMKEKIALEIEMKNKTIEVNKLKEKFETNYESIEAENVKLKKINERLLEALLNYQTEYLNIVKLKEDLSTAKDQQKIEKETVELKEPKMIHFDQLNLTDNITLSNKCNSFTMNCNFLDTNGAYTCETRNLIINQKEMELTKIYGTHLTSKSNQDVTELFIVKSYMFYWSKDIFTKFPALQILKIRNAQLNELTKGDFSSAFELRVLVVNGNNIESLADDVFHRTEENLIEINLNSNQIEKISVETFRGLKQLKVLSLKDNLITEIPFGSFKDIVMLEMLILTGNKIKFLDGKMLEFNKRLIKLAVDQNELREVGEEILNHSEMLKDVNFGGNDCIDERTGTDDDTDGRTENDLNFVIRNCCKKPGEGLNVYNCG